jgi:hypothetical protein
LKDLRRGEERRGREARVTGSKRLSQNAQNTIEADGAIEKLARFLLGR